jgi:predicted RNA polymerase sigma factor
MLLARLIDRIVRIEGRGVLATLVRLTGVLDAAEDAIQDAYAKALVVWARDGVPDNPAGWISIVARRAAIDRFRSDRSAALPPDLEAPPAPANDHGGI